MADNYAPLKDIDDDMPSHHDDVAVGESAHMVYGQPPPPEYNGNVGYPGMPDMAGFDPQPSPAGGYDAYGKQPQQPQQPYAQPPTYDASSPYNQQVPPAYNQSYNPGQPQYMPGQPPYNQGQGQGQATVTTTITRTVYMGPNSTPSGDRLTSRSCEVTCHHCGHRGQTTVEHQAGLLAWLSCGGLCLIGCWFGCCLIPFCIQDMQDTTHRCRVCHRVVGIYKIM